MVSLFTSLLLTGAHAWAADLPADAEAADAEAAAEAVTQPAPLVAGYHTKTLDNGLKVSVLTDPSHPVVATQTWVAVGSAHEGENETGFAHLFEHLMFGETENNGKDAYSKLHTRYGGYENAYTMFDNTVYLSQIQPSGHDQVLQLEADRMVNVILSQENLDNEKKIVTEELRLRGENDPVSRLIAPALRGLFGDHPYGHDPGGTKADVYAADLALCQRFYAGYYRPANMHLVVVGPVSGPQTIARIEALYAELPAEHTEPPEVPLLADWAFSERVELAEDIPPIKIASLVYRSPAQDSDDYWAWALARQMLSGGEVDLFSQELVTEKGKALEAMSFGEDLRAGGLMAFASVSLPFRSKGRALSLLHQTIDTLAEEDWLTEDKLETARRALLRDELERAYYADRMADALGQAWAWQGDETLALGGAAEAIDAVTLDQVRASWRAVIVDAAPTELFIKHGKPIVQEDEPEAEPPPPEAEPPPAAAEPEAPAPETPQSVTPETDEGGEG